MNDQVDDVLRFEFLAGLGASTLLPPRSNGGGMLYLDAAPLAHDIDPYRDAEIGVDELAWLYGDGLVGWHRGPVPLLADLPRRNEDGLRYHYTLRQAWWHDGRPVRAHDVAEALDAVRATAFGGREPYRSVREIVLHDEFHFDALLDSARPNFVQAFFGAYGVPALPLLRRVAGGMPIGTGPFEVRTRPELGRWRLARYDGSPRGRPNLDGIELRLISSETTANIQLLSGEADIALPLTPAAIGSNRFRRVERTTSTAVLLFNTETAFHDEAVRRSFARAVDVAALQRAYDRRRTSMLATLLLSGESDPAFRRSFRRDSHAGMILRSALGGREISIAYVRESAAQERTATLLQQFLAEIGVAAALHPAPGFIYQGAQGPLRTGRFDIAVAAFIYADEPDLAADWSCADRPPSGGNFGRWCDPAFETAASREDRPAMLRRLYDSMVCIPLSRAYEVLGVARRVGGFLDPTPLTPATYGCASWSLTGGSPTSARRSSDGRMSASRRSVDA